MEKIRKLIWFCNSCGRESLRPYYYSDYNSKIATCPYCTSESIRPYELKKND